MNEPIRPAARGRRPRLLGIAGSLRNARWGAGSADLLDGLIGLPDEGALHAWLTAQSGLHLQQFIDAGRAAGLDFLQVHRNLRRNSGRGGLSNSETALAAGLWAAHQGGVDIDHLALIDCFDGFGAVRDVAELRSRLLAADGLLLSGPVYFGDRGSLTESLFEFIRGDETLRSALAGRVFGGIAVGAKRNGGQETALIYQMLDALQLGLLVVGNDSDTTSQYGGTEHAGDVGTMHADRYGLDTSMGVGRRLAHVLTRLAHDRWLLGRPKALFLVLADDGIGTVVEHVQRLASALDDVLASTVIPLTAHTVRRCIACDICPTRIDTDDVYRCIIEHGRDDVKGLHPGLLEHDVLPDWLDGTPCEAPLNVAVDPEPDTQPAEACRWTERGFGHLKVKVGRDIDRDCRLARRLLDVPTLPARLAFDANQGFSLDEARRFADVLAVDPHQRVQWFEQPVDRHDWSGLEAVCRSTPVPVVIDESIGGLPDIERAVAIGAAGVKLKLCKHGGPDELARLLEAIPAELRFILGNGVATDITNAIELRVGRASGRCVAPAECSGFARLREPMYFDGLTVERGRARLAADAVWASRGGRPMEGR